VGLEVALGLVVGVTLGVFGEPAADDALFLLEHFVDAPVEGEGAGTEDGGEGETLSEKGEDEEDGPRDGEEDPTLTAEFVFQLDNEWMAYTYNKKGGSTCQDSSKIHIQQNLACKFS